MQTIQASDAKTNFLTLLHYDAACLAVALRHHAPLATFDKDLRAAAIASGVSLLS